MNKTDALVVLLSFREDFDQFLGCTDLKCKEKEGNVEREREVMLMQNNEEVTKCF